MAIDYISLVKQINDLHQKLQDKPEKDKLGYQISVGGILNAYREGDLSFDATCNLLKIKSNKKQTFIKELKVKHIALLPWELNHDHPTGIAVVEKLSPDFNR